MLKPSLSAPGISLSVVSHGHGSQLLALVDQLAGLRSPALHEVVVTLNIPEPELKAALKKATLPFRLQVIENDMPKGFGANHNAACDCCGQDAFCVMNPDVGLNADPFPLLLDALSRPGAGCSYPVQVNAQGQPQDGPREVPAPASLVRRYWRRWTHAETPAQPAHWVSGACMVFNTGVYRGLRGFDERYFMYCEDVDICLRLQLAGFSLEPCAAQVIHVATAASHRDPRHLAWHICSLLRLWTSDVLRRFMRLPAQVRK